MEKFDKAVSGQRLRYERIKRSLSQEEVAEKMGTTATTVSRWELGQTFPTPFFRRKLCELFEKSLQELFPLSSPEPTTRSPSERGIEANNTMGVQRIVLVESAREEEEHPEMDSVFRFNTPLTDASEFYGRRGEWIPLLRRLHLRASVSIIGPRRIGKTWLLSYLKLVAYTELGPSHHIGYVDTTMPSCDTLDDLTASMLEAFHASPLDKSTTNEHLTRLEKIVRKAAEKKETLVLCIDEFEGLCEKPGFHMSILERLRAMTNLGLCLVIASRHPLVKVVAQRQNVGARVDTPWLAPARTETSPFFNVFEQITLKPFVRKEAEAFAQAKSAQAGFTAQEYDYLLKFGQEEEGNQQWPPLRLQLVGKMIEEDKVLSKREPLYPHLPSDSNYWQEFKIRLEEKYQGVVGEM